MSTIWGYSDPAEQASMVLDHVRVAAYARAIAAVVQPGDVVLDVGTGTGVLAVLAARAGARRVFAIDRSGVVELARRVVADNGVAGIVEVIRADLTELDALPEAPRVVIGEQLGNFAPAEHQHRLYAIARRLAAPGAVMMPSRYRFVLGVSTARALRDDLARLDEVFGVRLGALGAHVAARPLFEHGEVTELLGPEVDGAWLDADGAPPYEVRARVAIDRDGELGAITAGFVAELAPGVELRAAVGAPRTHWTQSIFPVLPAMPVRAGEVVEVALIPRVVTSVTTWAWSVARGADVREVDGMDALIGDKRDLLAAMNVRVAGAPTTTPSPGLRAWAAALGAPPPEQVDPVAMAARAAAALPARYPNVDEALQDVRALLAAAAKLT